MKNFEIFVVHIVKKWKTHKKIILESAGLGELSNREYGDLAEEYVYRKIEKLEPKYYPFQSNGSQSPADIFAVGRRNGYWHIMLIQVKSSDNIETIYRLNSKDLKAFDEFAKFVKSEIKNSGILDEYKIKPIAISTGYAAVLRNKTKLRVSHTLVQGKGFKIFNMNMSSLDIESIKKTISQTHKL
ncbi:hypothetical protein CYCD_22450 [Tenuifilaceae bacterium CYCD]|nr:hypothetical protein CYCD_22450 [Tenuifilaceae bacterium CYCD]